MVISKTFWHCVPNGSTSLFFTITILTFEVIGLILNTLLTVFLFCLRTKGAQTSLQLLRAFTLSCFLSALVNFIEDIYPYDLEFDNVGFQTMVCLLWSSRWIYWMFTIMASQYLLIFTVDRTMDICQKNVYRLISESHRLLIYNCIAIIYSILITLPQLFTIDINEGKCTCSPIKKTVPFLAIIYAHVYLWVSLLLLFPFGVLVTCCCYIILYLKRTLPEERVDHLNQLTFYWAKSEKVNALVDWMTTSFCIIPLTISYLITFSYDSLYQVMAAFGVTTYIINGPLQKVGECLLVAHIALVPLILFIYILPLRNVFKRIAHKLCFGYCRH